MRSRPPCFYSIFADDASRCWTIEKASENLALSLRDEERDDMEENNEQPQWLTVFKEGVTFDEKATMEKLLKKPEYDTRHDFSFLTPTGRPVRCKVKQRVVLCCT